MAKMTIMVGLPASGKSTEAEKLVVERGNTVRINKDLLRTMLHFDKWSGVNESLTRAMAICLARELLRCGVNVIIDDTNLNPNTVQSWVNVAKDMDAKIEYKDFTSVPVDECVRRDAEREKTVGEHVIKKMALQNLGYLKGANAVICDLDGTLCDIKHRLHFVQGVEKKDWKNFFNEIPNDKLRNVVFGQVVTELTKHKAKLIFVSARPERYRFETLNWLRENKVYEFYKPELLIMRENGDKRPDTEVKSDIYEKYLKNLNIVKVFDDRPSVIRMWREKGLTVEDVGEGVEF